MANEKRLVLTEQEAIAKAEQELSTSRYIAECTINPGMRAIHDKRCSWLSVILGLAKKAINGDAVEVVHGRWIQDVVEGFSPFTDSPIWIDVMQCSVCKEYIDGSHPKNYCPNCGADMRDGDGNV